jgi:hypothetical protein
MLRILSRVLLLGAFFIFLASVLSPFLNIILGWPMGEYGFTGFYWSYKGEETQRKLGSCPETVNPFFNDYWFGPMWNFPVSIAFLDLSWILVATFVEQLFTVCSSIVALLTLNRKLLLVPLFTCITVILLTTYAEEQISSIMHQPIFELGYWLAFPSALLFFLAWISTDACTPELHVEETVVQDPWTDSQMV